MANEPIFEITGQTEATVASLPMCDIHKYEKNDPGVVAAYDARTPRGPWAYMCEDCFPTYSMGKLGTGYGQRLVLGT